MSERIEESPPPIHRSGRTVALLLIGAGLVLLLGFAGLFQDALWHVLWPLGLIGLGIDLATEGRYRRMVIVGTLVAVAILAPLVGLSRLVGNGEFWVERDKASLSVPLGDMERLKANISLTAGDLKIDDMDGDRDRAVNFGDSQPSTNFTKEGQTGILDIDGGWSSEELDLHFRRDLPLDLTIDIAAGNAEQLDFEDLQLERLNLTVGAGNAELKLPQEGKIDVTITSSAGDVKIEIPDDLSARIEIDASASKVEVDGDFNIKDGAYLSKGYNANDQNHVIIRIESSAGKVEIN